MKLRGPLKLVVVGDGAIGKSCMLITWISKRFPTDYVPTVFDNYVVEVHFEGKPIEISLWDTAGQEDYDRLRPLSYANSHIFLVCFSLVNPVSYEHVTTKWIPEVKHFCPDTPIILVGTKVDLRGSKAAEAAGLGNVTFEEGVLLAKRLQVPYCETSALTQEGLVDCFNVAIGKVVHAEDKEPSGRGLFSRSHKKGPQVPPVLPEAGRAPWINPLTAHYAEDMVRLVNNPLDSDVEFHFLEKVGSTRDAQTVEKVQVGEPLYGHKVILCGVSSLFRRLFGVIDSDDTVPIYSCAERNRLISIGLIPGITDWKSEGAKTIITISELIHRHEFIRVLEFWYTGLATLNKKKDDLSSLIRLAETFQCEELVTICENLRNGNEELNPSIGTYLNDQTGGKLKKLFFNKPIFSDLSFQVEGTLIPAHRSVVVSRCQVLAAALSGRFREGQEGSAYSIPEEVTRENFLAFLEYLYTDHAPIEDGDSIGILKLGDFYGSPRLISLCELDVTKSVERACRQRIERAEFDVIGLLLMAQQHGAKQLEQFCQHFISTNYEPFKKREEWKLLEGDNLKYMEEHRWPPVSYLKDLEEYEKKVKASSETVDSSCVVM